MANKDNQIQTYSKIDLLRDESFFLKQDIKALNENKIEDMNLDEYIFKKVMQKVDPIYYIENVLRAHLPEKKRYLHENQIELVKAVCNPSIRRVAALMARQCIVEGTIIHTRDGKLIPIEKHPNAWLTNENAEVLEIRVKGGHIIKCTANHPIMTKDGWKKAGLLTKDDWVCCLESWDKFGNGIINENLIMTDELAELLGYMTADGYMLNDKQSYKFTNINQNYLNRVESIVNKYFSNVEIKKYIKGNGYDYVFSGKNNKNEFRDFIKQMNFDKETRIPYAINKFTKSQVIAFFKGMWAGDGYISSKKRRGRVEYEAGLSGKTSLQYAEFLRELLNKLGIRCQIKKEWHNKSTKWFYRLIFSGMRNMRIFQETIGDIFDKPFPNVEFVKQERNIEIFQGEDNENLYYSPIVAINQLEGTYRVWDVEYPNKGWFICGGIKVHNSGKTESIASFTGYLLDNYPQMRIGIFTPRIQQAEINVGRTSIFYQQNEERLNNKIIKCNKDKIELSNGSYVMAVSGSDQSNIEGLTFDIIILDEAQKISDYTWSERIMPMGGATNAKMIKIGTPKSRNHFYQSFQSEDGTKTSWTKIRRDWTQCPQLWALDKTILPDKDTGELRPYSTYVLGLMPKALKQWYFPNNPEVWTDGDMSIEDFKTQYMLEFIDGAGKFFGQDDFDKLRSGEFDWLHHGQFGEEYYAGIDFAGSGAATADFTHITVIRKTPNGVKQKVWAMEMHGVSYPEQIRTIVRIFYGREAQFHCKKIFADYTGVGRPVIDSLVYDYGLTNLTGITFNGRDTYTNSGMNLKNVMFAKFRQDVENDRFKYPDKEHFIKSAGTEKNGFYHKMLGEWADLEQETRTTVNKIIQAPQGQHDDVCCADILANFASIVGTTVQRMPKASSGNFNRLR